MGILKKIIDIIKPKDRESGNGDDYLQGADFQDIFHSLRFTPARVEPPPVEITAMHIFLFTLTILSTLFAGAQLEGFDVIASFRSGLYSGIMALWQGFPFSLSLMIILGIHEMGHYLFSRKHGVDATLPYFLPAPTFIGTFGAFIKIKSPIYSKKALLEIGAAGPISGFIASVIALLIGLSNSEIVSLSSGGGQILLGESILMKSLTFLVLGPLPESKDVLLNSVAFAGWIGLLVTMLNLFPIGQLDGGHILYAVFPNRHRQVSQGAVIVLIFLSIVSINWIVWTILVIFLMQVKHPPVMDPYTPLSLREKRIAAFCLIIFLITFMPAPIRVSF